MLSPIPVSSRTRETCYPFPTRFQIDKVGSLRGYCPKYKFSSREFQVNFTSPRYPCWFIFRYYKVDHSKFSWVGSFIGSKCRSCRCRVKGLEKSVSPVKPLLLSSPSSVLLYEGQDELIYYLRNQGYT